MGLFGLKKKKEEAPSFFGKNDPLQSTTGLDKSMDLNSGLQLDSLGMDQEQPPIDSFGNPRPQRRYEDPMTSQLNYSQSGQQNPASNDINKDLQIILAKLDAIKAEVQTLGHRIENLERLQQNPGQKRYNW